MATSYSVVVVIAVVLCGFWATSQGIGQPVIWDSESSWDLDFRRRREVETGEDRQEQLARYAHEIIGNDNAATQKNMFQAIDMDSDGSISLSEWSRADVIEMIDLFCSLPQKEEKEGY